MHGAIPPIVRLLIAAPLADVFGNSTVMTGLGLVIILVGATSARLDHGHRRRQQQRPHRHAALSVPAAKAAARLPYPHRSLTSSR